MIPKPDKPAWSGPYEGGITQSLLNRFLQCPFQFYLYAICGLKEPKALNNNLIWGDILHVGLEHALRGETLQVAKQAMLEYTSKKYPRAPATYNSTTWEMLQLYPIQATIDLWEGIDTEVVINDNVLLPGRVYCNYQVMPDRMVRVRGKVDMLAKNRTRIGDHKCKGRVYAQETLQELLHDLQMNLYSYMLGSIENWQYDLIQIPEEAYRVPPPRGVESADHWANRIFHVAVDSQNGFPISRYVNRWIYNIPHFQPVDKIKAYFNYTIAPLMHRICDWWDYVTHPSFDPNDPACYNGIFYQTPIRLFDPTRTDKFKCHFHSILTEQMEYDDLVPVDDFYAELPEDE